MLTLDSSAQTAYAAELDRWLSLPSSKRRHAFFAQLKAEITGYKGEADRCIESVIASDELGLTDLLWIDRCPALDLVRHDPRFVLARSHVAARAGAILAALE